MASFRHNIIIRIYYNIAVHDRQDFIQIDNLSFLNSAVYE